MIGASKILTVSYGTFSCTLEGFDDPFNTMKAIAEYFRDLAAEDRYFGAEPPQPDAAMLHRIAEREIQRRVEARVQDNGVILRADTDAAPVARLAEPEPAPAPAPAPTVIPAKQAAAVTESVAAKLSKLRAAKAVPEAAVLDFPAATEADEPEALLPDPGLAEFLSPAAAAVPPAATEPAPVADAITEAEVVAEAAPAEPVAEVAEIAAVAEVIAVEPATAEVDAEAAPEVAVPEALADALPEGLAEELDADAARALSDALSGVTVEAAAPRAEDAPVHPAGHSIEELFPEGDALPDDVDDILPETAAPLSAAEAPEDVDLAALIAGYAPDSEVVEAEVVEAEVVAEESRDLDLETLIGSLTDVAEAEAEPVAPVAEAELVAEAEIEDAAEVEDAVEVEVMAAPEAAAEVVAEAEIVTEPLPDDLAAAPEPVETVIEAEAVSVPAVETETDEPAAARPEAAEKLQRARARVVRIRRADAEPAPAATAEADAEPRRKLEVEADDAALNRLIAQTNTEMEGPEAKRRLSAIAHLKAAVAATVADRLTRGKPAPTEAARAEPYRDDLARAVRPARPEAPAIRGERPAPLVLVSEQRIDRPAPVAPAQPPMTSPVHVTPVRPRRVSSSALAVQADDDDEDDEDSANIFADTRGFVEFAEKLGVRSLPDLMEAAAAYTASVEGRPHFSRPHLIKHLTAARGAELPREDSLRTFGRLLREGRIEKIKRGQFAVNEGSRFLTEARKING